MRRENTIEMFPSKQWTIKRGKKGKNPLGQQSPWSWAIEPTRGCNLRCGHCAARLFPNSGRAERFMTDETWDALWRTIAAASPYTRVEMANAGEPTLHPKLSALIHRARELSLGSQIQITTNGTMLVSGVVTYEELFSAGANIVYVDMYAPIERHVELAEASGVDWYFYHSRPKGAPGAWEYTSASLRLIVLMEQPANWPASRKKLNRLGTFFNNLDWDAARPFGLIPVVEPLMRGCTQPFRYVSVDVDGNYQLCCQDFMGETSGTLGNVNDGCDDSYYDAFLRFWFGEKMQTARRELRRRDRSTISQCSRCSITFSRSDMLMWKDEKLASWWNGKEWDKFKEGGQ